MTAPYDVIVVGGGHAGCEAAAAAARCGARTALVALSRSAIGAMSCNPAIGGVGKGHLVREVDAMDGLMARAADHAGVHYRMLNSSKGKAVHGPRIQADRKRYACAIQAMLAEAEVEVIEGEVSALAIHAGAIAGLILSDATDLRSRAVVLATGTFLDARMFCGGETIAGGRAGEASSTQLAAQLREAGLPLARMKTGTPPRLDGRTIAWERLRRQESDPDPWTMSPMSVGRAAPQLSCGITRTNSRTHEIIREARDRSPLYDGSISSSGPRYCPSVEDKVLRFGDRDAHQIFLEPEGLDSSLVYPNGISTSLPRDIQTAFVQTIWGLGKARIVNFGYAVEYEYVDPRALDKRLALRDIPGLFLAGQINGTTGYEEAAGQGVVAGLNAAGTALEREPVVFERDDSYIGVMVDDLTLQGVTEPYRMLTARAEYRLRLRADNAETRLDSLAAGASCLSPARLAHRAERLRERDALRPLLERIWTAADLSEGGCAVEQDGPPRPLAQWLTDPSIAREAKRLLCPERLSSVAAEFIEDARYAPYVERQAREVVQAARDRSLPLPSDIDYGQVAGLSNEMVERLTLTRPGNLDEASRIRGITPAALSAILVVSQRKAA